MGEAKPESKLSRRDFLELAGLTGAGIAVGAVATGSARAERGEIPQKPLEIELAGEGGGEDPWPFWRIRNPNPTTLAFKVELPEIDKKGNLITTRIEEPANRWSLYDIRKDMAMVPAGGSIIIDYPPTNNGRQINPRVSILEHSGLTDLGYRGAAEDEFKVTPKVDNANHLITFDIEATHKLQGKIMVQAQLVFLNKEGRVVKEITTLPNEFNHLSAGQHFFSPSLNLVGSDIPSYSSFELNYVGLAHP